MGQVVSHSECASVGWYVVENGFQSCVFPRLGLFLVDFVVHFRVDFWRVWREYDESA